MIRRLFTAASILSLLAFIAVVALWIRSMSHSDIFEQEGTDPPQDVTFWEFGTAHGALVVFYRHISREPIDSSSDFPFRLKHPESQEYDANEMKHHFAGFGWERARSTTTDGVLNFQFQEVAIPLWAISLALLLPPIIIFRWLWRTRRVQGHCPKCGYDLRASTERCPECGTPILLMFSTV